MPKKRRIAVLIAGLEGDAQQNLASGMTQCAIERDYDLCFFNSLGATDSSVERYETSEREIYSLPDLSTFDGVAVLYATINNQVARDTTAELLATCKNIPVVSFDYPVENAINLTCDDRQSLQELLCHMVDDHHAKRIAFVSGPADNAVAQNRLMTFRQFLRERGITLHSEDIYYGGFIYAGGMSAADHFAAEGKTLPDAIICANDNMALGLIEGLRRHGYQAPKDVKVTGFDKIEEAVNHNPSITSIYRPLDKCGYAIIDNIDRVLGGEQAQDNVLLPTEIYYGQSCGCEIASDDDAHRATSTIYRQLRNSEHNMILVSRLSNAMSGIQSFDDLAARLLGFVKSCNLTEMYVCIDSDRMQMARKITIMPDGQSRPERRKGRGYGKAMQMIFGYDHGVSYPSTTLNTKELLPLYGREREASSQLVYCPLYYRDRNFGYVAFNVKQATGFILYAVLVVLGGALESLSMQATIHAYAKALEESVIHDPMTGLLNRRGYLDVSKNYYQIALEQKQTLMIVSGDVNGLKAINDRFGHMEGDFAIRQAAKAVGALESENVSCVHLSGDEFMVIGIDVTREQMNDMMLQVKDSLAKLNTISGKPYVTSLSMGGYIAVPDPSSSLEDFINQADDRMYIEKKEQKRRAALLMAQTDMGREQSLSDEISALQKAMREQSTELLAQRLVLGTVGLYQQRPVTQCYIGPELLEFLGYTSKRYQNQSQGQFVNCIYPEDLERVLTQYDAMTAGGDVFEQRYRLVRQDGSIVWVGEQAIVTTLSPCKNVINSVLLDISEQMQTTEQLELCQQRLKQIYHQIHCVVFDYDIAGGVLTLSSKAKLLYGLPEAIHQPMETLSQLEFVHPDSMSELCELYHKALETEATVGCTLKLRQAGGAYHLCRVTLSTLYSMEHKPLRVVGQVEALTGQKETERRYDEAVRRHQSLSFGVLASYIVNVATDSPVQGNCFRGEMDDLCRGETHEELMQAILQKIPTQEEREQFESQINRDYILHYYEDGGNLLRIHYRRCNRHGRVLWVSLTIELIPHPITGDVIAFATVRDIDQSKRKEINVSSRAENDLLTGLYTWETMQAMAEPMLVSRERNAEYALLLIDIDHYHLVKDELGQRGAEQLLQETASLLQQMTHEGDLACRVSRDLFAMFLCERTTSDAALAFEQTLRERFAEYTTAAGVKRPITVCTALCFAHAEETSLERLYQRARHELLLAKQQGAGQSAMLPSADDESGSVRLTWRDDYEGQAFILIDPDTQRVIEISQKARQMLMIDTQQGLCHELLCDFDTPCAECPILAAKQDHGLSCIWLRRGDRRILALGRMVEHAQGEAYLETLIDMGSDEQLADTALSRELLTDSLLLLNKAVGHGEDRTDQLLGALARYYGSPCAYVAECDSAHKLSAVYECRLDGKPNTMLNLHDIPLGNMDRWWQAYEARKAVTLPSLAHLPYDQKTERELLAKRGVTSYLAMPYSVKDVTSGFVVVENPACNQDRLTVLECMSHLMEMYWLFSSYEKRNHFLFYHDAMTGAYNRHRYQQYITDSQHSQPSSLGYLSIDVNNLKWLNENYGYLYGDELICRLSSILQRTFPDDWVFRISGDLFHVVCEDMPYSDFTRRVDELKRVTHEEISETVSIGCIWADSDISLENLSKNADELRILNKRELMRESEQNAEQERLKGLQTFNAGIRDKQYLMFLQPRVDLKTGMISGAEALVRMEHPRFGLIAPAKFVPLMEREGIISMLDLFITEEAYRLLSDWKRRGAPLTPISLNYSSQTLLEDGLTNSLQALKRKYPNVPDGMIEIEMSEGMSTQDRSQFCRVGEELKAMGYKIDLDQFGARFANIAMLTAMPYHTVKLDRKLIANVDTDEAARSILESVLSLCRKAKVESVAVGVETEGEMAVLKELGCDQAQGYLMGKPMPSAEFEKRYIG